MLLSQPAELASLSPARLARTVASTNFAKHRYKSFDNASGRGRRYTRARFRGKKLGAAERKKKREGRGRGGGLGTWGGNLA